MTRVIAACLMLMLANVGFAQDKEASTETAQIAKEVMAKAQGKWTLNMKVNDQTVRSIKEIKGNKETVTRYMGDKIIAQWTVDFEITHIEKYGVNVFTYHNMTMTDGPAKGEVNEGTFEYVFKIQGGKWYELHGIQQSDPRVPVITIYRRAGDDDNDDDDDDDDDDR